MEKIDNQEGRSVLSELTYDIFLKVARLAGESVALGFIWERIIVTTFDAPSLSFGFIFVILAALKYIVREIFLINSGYLMMVGNQIELEKANKALTEILDVMVYSEQNRAFQFKSNIDIIKALVDERNNSKNEQQE